MFREWRTIKDSPCYSVSNFGEVKRTEKRDPRSKSNVDLLRCMTICGYSVVTLPINGKWKKIRVHRLVATAFLGFSSLLINHKDGNKKNNKLDNLEYVTAAENSAHASRLGLLAFGDRNTKSKLTKEDVLKIRDMLSAGVLQKTIAKKYGVIQTTISAIKLKKNWAFVVLLMSFCRLGFCDTNGIAIYYSTETCKFNKDPKCPTSSGRSLYALEKEGVLFAASYRYALGQRVAVINQENGKRVIVTILDRGPNKRLGRVIDLGRAAFEKIGDTKKGLIPVTVEAV